MREILYTVADGRQLPRYVYTATRTCGSEHWLAVLEMSVSHIEQPSGFCEHTRLSDGCFDSDGELKAVEGDSSDATEPLGGLVVGDFKLKIGCNWGINVQIMCKTLEFRAQKMWHGTTGVRHER